MGFALQLQPSDSSFLIHPNLNPCQRFSFSPLSNLNKHWVAPHSFPPRYFHASRPQRKNRSFAACAAAGDPPAQALRRILESPGIHQGPTVFDAISAKLVERAGFQFCFMGGFAVSAARLGLPDVGLISYGEMIDQGYQITQAVSIPVIGDGDNGYGNHMNVRRTVKGFIKAGFGGILLEDQVSPKACGHTRGRKVASREEAVMRIKAAIDARKESGSDIVIIARTDSRQAVSFEESLWRSRAFADAGADVLFIDALASREEMKAFCQISPLLPKLANMLEGGGRTPILNPIELEEIGFKIISYPLSLIGVSIRAMEDALRAIKGGRVPPPGSLPSFEEIKEIVGFNEYYDEEERYKSIGAQSSYEKGTKIREAVGERAERLSEPVIEVLSPYDYDRYKSGDYNDRLSGIWSRTLRLKVTGSNGLEKLDVRVPAGFLEGMANIIPGLGGVNILELLENASQEVAGSPEKGKLLLDFDGTMGDRIQVFVE
ncbi:Carboxyvinyl-carboxyphosphonate phosphorylmutase, chloroplastic [Apostasia shenzhenica]|uniref:Carboxyvinyl-carboxyphosphonate phosphorylmutase, chloroplastic n=1 Tax=Apostasia shenzhenica TaxID=1088818 RepID=A0A2I0AUT1_9ASPA|nr:Carboxyvinyl-carboxyphosphonate phosphorylmutase, chloroplastic [Apostasia shenzhenica]